jgi:hypothetical protein
MVTFDPKLTLTPRQRPNGKWYVEASGPDSIPRAVAECFAEWEAKIWIQNFRRLNREKNSPKVIILGPQRSG